MAASVVSPPVDVFTEEAGPCRATVYDAVAGKESGDFTCHYMARVD